MRIFNWRKNRLDEANKSFKTKLKPGKVDTGEGHEDMTLSSQSLVDSLSSFNLFDKYINQQHKNETEKINNYRAMAAAPEISDVVEDAVLESVQEDGEGYTLSLDINDKDIKDNENKVKTLNEEFEDLFFNKLRIDEQLWNMLYSYYIDARVYMERIGKNKVGITDLKLLPCETMDFKIGNTGRIEFFVQYLKKDGKLPSTLEEAEKDHNMVAFYPSQVSYINTGMFGSNKKDVIGFLEKAKQPYNQLKLLETAVIIYRIIRAPERFVFRIDTGNMPKDKAMKYVEKLKSKFQRSETYDPDTGNIVGKSDIMSMLENFWLPQCLRLSTKISTLDGEKKELSQIIEEHNNGIKNEVYSVDQKTGKIIKGEVEWAGITRKDAELVRVWFNNNEYIDVTPDHKFVKLNNKEKQAQYLKNGESLMPFYTRNGKIDKRQNEYKQLFDLKDRKWKFVHRIFGPKLQAGHAIHHIDFNRFNNQSDNLISMPVKEHIKLHYKSNKERNSHIPLLEALNKPENREKQRRCAREYQVEKWKDHSLRKYQSDIMKARWKQDEYRKIFIEAVSRPKSESHKINLSESIKNKFQNDPEYRAKHAKASKERWNNEEFRNHMLNVLSVNIDKKISYLLKEIVTKNNFPSQEKLIKEIIPNDEKIMKYWNELNEGINTVKKDKIGKTCLYKILNSMGYNDYTEFKKNIRVNHKVKKVEKLNIREDTGCLTIKDPGENHNFAVSAGVFVKNSADGRGSQIDTIGGNASGFAELDDIYFFQRKLYRALKYPMSRVTKIQEKQEGDMLFAGGRMGEITRDEIKWAKFLERQQNRICYDLKEIFLLHLEFKGIKKEYELKRSSFNIHMTPPNQYKDQIDQMLLETKQNNYLNMANQPELPKTWLMKEYLGLDEEDFKEIKEYIKKDEEYLPEEEGF